MLKNLNKFDYQFNCGKEICDLKNRFVVQLTSLFIRKLIFWHTFALPQCTHSLKSCDVDKKKSSKTENLLAIQRRALEGKKRNRSNNSCLINIPQSDQLFSVCFKVSNDIVYGLKFCFKAFLKY